MFFNDWLTKRRLLTPDRVAIVDEVSGRTFSYSVLDGRAARLGSYLRKSWGVQPGDRVACLAANRVELLDLYFACGKLGAMLVPLNFRLPAAAVRELLQDCQPRLLAYESSFAELALEARRSGIVPEVVPFEATDSARDESCLSTVLEQTNELREPTPAYEAHENEVAMILYTSGTTGRPKGAMISWRQIHWNALNTIIGLGLTEEDAAFLNMPLYHTSGWHVLFSPLMLVGGRVILQQGFHAERCNTRIGPEGVTILFAVPTMMRMMREAPNFHDADFSGVRFAICGGEPCALPLIEAYHDRGVAVRQGYGLTEAGPNCFSLPAADAVRKLGSVGLPNFHVAVRLVKEDGSTAGVDEVGELWMKGPHVFSGYWADDQATAAVLREGWVATGDLMRRDAEGYFSMVGRKKDMYISGGENVYPAQVERVLQSHDAVALAAVVAVPDPKWGEIGWAFVTMQADQSVGEGELLDWCKRHLATFQCPRQFVVMQALPVGHSGKIDKRTLAQLARDMIGQ